LPSGASAVVDENLLAGNDLSLGRLAAINLLRDCWAEQQERRKGKRENTASCHGNLISRQEYLKDSDDRSSIAPSARSRPIPDIRRLAGPTGQRDRLTQRTNTGIHKDDLIFSLNENIFKAIASQGQRKSLLFACKLAEFDILKVVKKSPPILLLDDVFEKLDEKRIKNLLEYVCRKNTGQVFITDTHLSRLTEALSQYENEVQIIELD